MDIVINTNHDNNDEFWNDAVAVDEIRPDTSVPSFGLPLQIAPAISPPQGRKNDRMVMVEPRAGDDPFLNVVDGDDQSTCSSVSFASFEEDSSESKHDQEPEDKNKGESVAAAAADDSLSLKPKRALTAYNLFFQEERRKMLYEEEGDGDEEIGGSCEASPSPTSRIKNSKRSKKKVGFATMARTVSARWKQANEEERDAYQKLAALDKLRYKREMKEWKLHDSKKKKKQSGSSSNNINKQKMKKQELPQNQQHQNTKKDEEEQPKLPQQEIEPPQETCVQLQKNEKIPRIVTASGEQAQARSSLQTTTETASTQEQDFSSTRLGAVVTPTKSVERTVVRFPGNHSNGGASNWRPSFFSSPAIPLWNAHTRSSHPQQLDMFSTQLAGTRMTDIRSIVQEAFDITTDFRNAIQEEVQQENGNNDNSTHKTQCIYNRLPTSLPTTTAVISNNSIPQQQHPIPPCLNQERGFQQHPRSSSAMGNWHLASGHTHHSATSPSSSVHDQRAMYSYLSTDLGEECCNLFVDLFRHPLNEQ